MEKLNVNGVNVEMLKEIEVSLVHGLGIMKQYVEQTASRRSQFESCIDQIQAEIESRVNQEDFNEEKSLIQEVDAENLPEETLKAITKVNMKIINAVSKNSIASLMIYFGTSVDVGSVMDRCEKTKKMLSELPQDDYKSRYMISTKTIEFIFSEYEKASTIESEEKGSTCSVKKIGTNK